MHRATLVKKHIIRFIHLEERRMKPTCFVCGKLIDDTHITIKVRLTYGEHEVKTLDVCSVVHERKVRHEASRPNSKFAILDK